MAALDPDRAAADAGAALVCVLTAEAAARAATAACDRQAATVQQQARDAARRIGARAALRSARVRTVAQQQAQRDLADLEARRAALAAEPADHATDVSRIRAAVCALASALLAADEAAG
jgi:hypothetical protein